MSHFKLDEEILDALFPFYFFLDKNLQFTHKGSSLKRIIPDVIDFEKTMAFNRPHIGIEYSFSSICTFAASTFILKFKDPSIKMHLKGSFQYSAINDSLIFCGAPWITTQEDLIENKLTLNDFGQQDFTTDYIVLINELNNANKELQIANQSIKNQKKYIDAVLDNIPLNIVVFDPDLRFQYINKQAIKDDQLREYLIGKTEFDYWNYKKLPYDYAQLRMKSVVQSGLEKRVITIEETLYKDTEKEKTYLRAAYPHYENEQLLFYINYGTDITELAQNRKQLEEKNAELEKVNEELDRFVYSVSHNLRAPLTSIMGITNLIKSYEFSREEMLEFMHNIHVVVQRLDDTIHDIIEYSKNSRMFLEAHEIDIHKSVHTIIEQILNIEGANVKINQSYDIKAPICSDINRLHPLIHNILSNAVKYADKSKEQPMVNLKVESNEDNICITVADNGIGIAHHLQSKIFDMFYRATNMSAGSGLGLYIVREIVNKLKGSIKIESEERIGTTVTLNIPNMKPTIIVKESDEIERSKH